MNKDIDKVKGVLKSKSEKFKTYRFKNLMGTVETIEKYKLIETDFTDIATAIDKIYAPRIKELEETLKSRNWRIELHEDFKLVIIKGYTKAPDKEIQELKTENDRLKNLIKYKKGFQIDYQ